MSGLHASTRLGDLLVKKGKISPQQLFEAIRFQQNRRLFEAEHGLPPSARNELGAILVELGFISRKQLRNSLSWQRKLRKATLVMTFFAPLLTVACGGGSAGPNTTSPDIKQTTSQSSSSTPSSDSSSSSSPDASSLSSSSVFSTHINSSSSALSSSSLASPPSSSSAFSPSSSSSALSSSSISEPLIAGSVLVMWTPPTKRQNGEFMDIAELGGYELRYKLKHESSYKSVHIKNGYTDSYYFAYLKGNYEFEIAAYDSDGLYSAFVPIKRQKK